MALYDGWCHGLGYFEKLLDSLSFRGNIPGLFISGIIECSAWQMYDLVWQPYLISLGGSTPLIGMILSVWNLFNALLQLITGELADSVGRKTLLNYYYLFTITGMILAVLANNWWYFVAVNVFFGIADALEGPSFSPMIAESVPKEKIAVAMSMITLMWSIPGFYGQAVGGYLADRMGTQCVMYLVLGIVVVAALIFYLTTEETLKKKKPFSWSAVFNNLKGLARLDPGLRVFYLVSVLDRFGWAINRGILVTMFGQAYGFSLTQIGLLMTVEMVALTFVSIPIGRALETISNKKAIMFGLALNVLVFGSYVFASNYFVLLFLQALKGVNIGIWDTAIMLYQNNAVVESERGKTFGNINSLKGLIAVPAPFIGAILFGFIGFKGVFTISTLVLGVAFIASRWIHEPTV